MKSFFFLQIFFLVFTSLIYSQDQGIPAVHLSSIPKDGISLDNGWKFHEGDDTAWANPQFDDRSWKTVSLNHFATDYLPQLAKKRIGWFRIRVFMDSAIRSNPVAILISQLGASDLYINGIMFLRLGRIGPGKITQTNNPHDKPYLYQGSLSGDTATLAVRFASPPPYRSSMLQKANARPLSFRISPWSDAVNDYKSSLISPRWQIGYSFMCIGLGVLFVLLYSFLPKERINILFAGYCFFVGMMPGISTQLSEGDLNMQAFGWAATALEICGKCCSLIILWILAIEVTSRLSYFQMALIFYILVLDSLMVIFWGNTRGQMIADMVAHMVFAAELARLSFLALRQRNYLMGIVGIASFALNVALLLGFFHILYIPNSTRTFFNFAFFILLSIYIATKYARNSSRLVQKLVDNTGLSIEKVQLLKEQNDKLAEQVNERTMALGKSMQELKETQSLLIQSEKMASLGELTAGIAHEIQNPLNFVNNFSEINTELIGEMEKDINAGQYAEALQVAKDIQANLEKISYHGKRAETIVKGMLLHSRVNAMQKEPADINALADEYLRLGFHGLRAKDKSFNATMVKDFDPEAGSIMIVAPDIGRVLLNLFNNAFYSVTEKKKKIPEGYEPTLTVSTRKYPDRIEIRVRDNGLGISPKIIDKIFNPFFTNKPPGLGTGLGLSLSYDIVTKEHGGKLNVNAEQGEFAEFIIDLPFKEYQ